jgi:hypothetical protein
LNVFGSRGGKVSEGAVRVKNGLKKALIYGGIAAAATVGLGMATVGVKGGLIAGAIDYAFGTGILKTVGISGLAIVGAAAGAGFLMGSTDDRAVVQALATARRADMHAAMHTQGVEPGLGAEANEYSLANQMHRSSLIGGNFSPPPYGGGGGGSGPSLR